MMKKNIRMRLADAEPIYPIRTVSELTGVHSTTLRAWERRYGIISPQRTTTGHRLFSAQDIQKINLILQFLEQGISISKVEVLLIDYEKGIVEQQDDDNAESPLLKNDTKEQWSSYQLELMQYIETYDLSAVNKLHYDLVATYPLLTVSRELIKPVLNQLKEKTVSLSSSYGEFNFYKNFLRSFLGEVYQSSLSNNHSRKILLFSICRRDEEVGMLLTCLPLQDLGYQIIMLGSRLPLESIPVAISRVKADFLVLYSNTSPIWENDVEFRTQTRALFKSLKVPLFLAGDIVDSLGKELERPNLIALAEEVEEQIKQFNQSFKL